MRLAAGITLLILAVGCGNNSSTAKQPDGAATTAPPTTTTTTATATPGALLPDDAIKQAITSKQEILIVKVVGIDGAAAGSRSETTTYTLDVVRAALGSSKGPLKLSHYGAPKLEKGKSYAVTTRDGNPMWGTKGLRESVEITTGQEDAAATAHADKAKALGAP